MAEVRFSSEAEDDLFDLYRYVANEAGRGPAIEYAWRLRTRCAALSSFPRRGRLREDLAPGLRILGFERRVTIAYREVAGVVEIVRIFYGAQDWEPVMLQERP